ncbi:MAG: hypothetical protein AB1Z98_07275 [Nannocystaceae bacterium]
MIRRSSLLLALVLAPVLPAPAAHAANGLRPRTPAVFENVACVQTVTQGEVLNLEYSVPYDDLERTPEELPDTRVHQFFAFSRTRYDFSFPIYINQSDFDRSAANGDQTVEYTADDILESSSLWPAGTWVRITADDARVPITAAQAAMGVTWDTSSVAPGTWMVAGYTWEPEKNLWSPRFGAVRVVDPASPEATGPTVFMPRQDGLLANRGEPMAVQGCIEAPEGSTLTASWGTIAGGSGGVGEPEWVPFVEDEPVQTGELALEFVAPAEAGGTVKLRVEITDPDGRSYVAFTPTTIAVVGEVVETDDDGGGGCACANERPRGPWALLGLLGLLGPRFRRRQVLRRAC